MRLSPYETGKPAKGFAPNFAEFASTLPGDDDEGFDIEGYDSLGSALRGSQAAEGAEKAGKGGKVR